VIGVDTNVIVRFLAQDDDVQSPTATRFMSRLSRERPGFVSAVVLAEVSWVLSRAYKVSRDDLAEAIEGLLRSAELMIENADAAYRALSRYQASKSVEFADALIAQIALVAGADEVVTFDQTAASQLGVRLLR
jgi:predicted nucleic-acid-binding protein